jgi:hypothetical protein
VGCGDLSPQANENNIRLSPWRVKRSMAPLSKDSISGVYPWCVATLGVLCHFHSEFDSSVAHQLPLVIQAEAVRPSAEAQRRTSPPTNHELRLASPTY